MTIYPSLAILLLLPAAMALEVQAQTVNKWVDDEGVTHFSDQRPAGGDTDVREIEIPQGSVSEFDAGEVNERVNSVLQQLEQDRKAREAEAAARIKAREEEKALELEAVVEENKKKKKRAATGRTTDPTRSRCRDPSRNNTRGRSGRPCRAIRSSRSPATISGARASNPVPGRYR